MGHFLLPAWVHGLGRGLFLEIYQHHTEEHKERLRGSGNPMSKPEVKEKHRLAMNSNEYKEKQRAAMKRNGNPMDRPEVKEKHRLAMLKRRKNKL